MCGAALVTIVSLVGAVVTPRRVGAHVALPAELTCSIAAGVLATLTTARAFEAPNRFFADFGTNGLGARSSVCPTRG